MTLFTLTHQQEMHQKSQTHPFIQQHHFVLSLLWITMKQSSSTLDLKTSTLSICFKFLGDAVNHLQYRGSTVTPNTHYETRESPKSTVTTQ